MEEKELAFQLTLLRYENAIKDLPGSEQAVDAVIQMLFNISAGLPEEGILNELMAMFPKECVSEHLAAMQSWLSDLLEAYTAYRKEADKSECSPHRSTAQATA